MGEEGGEHDFNRRVSAVKPVKDEDCAAVRDEPVGIRREGQSAQLLSRLDCAFAWTMDDPDAGSICGHPLLESRQSGKPLRAVLREQ